MITLHKNVPKIFTLFEPTIVLIKVLWISSTPNRVPYWFAYKDTLWFLYWTRKCCFRFRFNIFLLIFPKYDGFDYLFLPAPPPALRQSTKCFRPNKATKPVLFDTTNTFCRRNNRLLSGCLSFRTEQNGRPAANAATSKGIPVYRHRSRLSPHISESYTRRHRNKRPTIIRRTRVRSLRAR